MCADILPQVGKLATLRTRKLDTIKAIGIELHCMSSRECHACDSSKQAIDDHPESTANTQARQRPALEHEAEQIADSVSNHSSMGRRHRSLHVDQDIDLQWLAIHLNCLVGCDADDEVFRKILAT